MGVAGVFLKGVAGAAVLLLVSGTRLGYDRGANLLKLKGAGVTGRRGRSGARAAIP